MFIIGLFVGLLVAFLVPGLDVRQRCVAGIFCASVVLWMTEAMPLAMTAMLSTVALVVTGSLTAKEAFGAYGDQIILLFVGSFILAKSMEESGLDRRLALWILGKKWATKSSAATLFAFGAIACFISLFVSNTATTAMLLPIALRVLRTVGLLAKESGSTHSFLLMLTWGSSIAVGTIIGTPPNVLGVGLIRDTTGVKLNFLQWAGFAMPITILMLIAAWFLLRDPKSEEHNMAGAREFSNEELGKLGPWSGSEKVTLAGFLVAVALWIFPGIAEYALGSGTPTSKLLTERIPEAVAALLGAAVLFLIPVKDTIHRRAMNWNMATKIEWGTIMLFAGGLALGKAAFDSKLANLAGHGVANLTGANDVWTITALATLMAILVSELASNTASANVMVPVALAIAAGAGVNPIPAGLGATIGANLGFMLPISTPPNAIIYSTRLVPAKVLMKKGLVFDILGFLVTMLCLRIFLPLLGLA